MNERTERKCTHSFFQKIGDKNCMPCIQYEKWGYSAGARWCLGRDYRCRESCYASPISTPKVGPRDQNSKLKRSWGKSWVSSRKKGLKRFHIWHLSSLLYLSSGHFAIIWQSPPSHPSSNDLWLADYNLSHSIAYRYNLLCTEYRIDILVIALWWYTIPLKRPKFGR